MIINVEQHDAVAVVRLARNTTNALNRELVDALDETLERLGRAPEVRGLVLASANDKFFSIGFDIPKLFELSREEFGGYYRAFNGLCLKLMAWPGPTFAAITGHAIAGGCVLALCCDYRFIADGRKLIGLNEIKLGVPVPYVADCVLRQLVGVGRAREIADDGEFLPPKRAQDAGLVDQVIPLGHVVARAVARCQVLSQMPAAAFGMNKRNRIETVEQQVAANLEQREQYFVDCWYAKETRERLRAAMEKF